ncbi:MAG: cytochrome c peroxidase [Planctomycetota bacterium]|jgi:cytochrome c peroxidase
MRIHTLRRCSVLFGWATAVLLGLQACGGTEPSEADLAFLEKANAFVDDAPPAADLTNRFAQDEGAAVFGMRLFGELEFSGQGTRSCITCHDSSHAFSDMRSLSHGEGQVSRHAPTLVNVAYGHWFGWGGKMDSLWSQALGPLEHPAEMGGDRLAIAHHVAATPDLSEAYIALFGPLPDLGDSKRFPAHGLPEDADPGGARATASAAWSAMQAADRDAANRVFSNLGKALAAYQTRLISGPSPFDRKVLALRSGKGGPVTGWNAAAARGFDLFTGQALCVVCHSGPQFSDGEFHNTGAPPLLGGEPEDPARYLDGPLLQASIFRASGPFSDHTTGQRAQRTERLKTGSEQWGEFKTPSLRNLLNRAPYMHQGQFGTLVEVVDFYDTRKNSVGQSHHQEQILRPLGLTKEQRSDLLAFLGALQGTPVPTRWSAPTSN